VWQPDTDTAPSEMKEYTSLLYNEYICYDVAQVKLRYLFRVRMSGY
jgi:poly [ADP-ribose] polymerase 2/3/4